jgi:glycine/D-amino acid oxidase-like deaminating enzyme
MELDGVGGAALGASMAGADDDSAAVLAKLPVEPVRGQIVLLNPGPPLVRRPGTGRSSWCP